MVDRASLPDKVDEVKNAKCASLIVWVVPPTPEVRVLLNILMAQHPGLDVDKFLAMEESSFNML